MMKSIYKMAQLAGSSVVIDPLDYLILASGSDARAYEVLSKCNLSSECRIIVINYKERLSGMTQADALFSYKKLRRGSLQEIDCDIKHPSSILDEIAKNNFEDCRNVGIDISCMTKPYLYYIIKMLKERYKLTKLSVFYTEPKSYHFPKGLFSAFRTSCGPLSVLEIPGYSGQERRGAKRKLIILLGFDGDLSKEINEDVSPHETVIVNGFPAYMQKYKDISLNANEKLVGDRNIKIEYARANNPFEVYNLLQSIKTEETAGSFINVAPLGTKPMALGACMFALHNPDVRIVYPFPDNYENKYSDKSWSSWVYELSLTAL